MLQQQATVLEGWRVASGTSSKDPMFNDDGGTIRLQIEEFKKRGLDLDLYFGGKKDEAYICGTLGLDVTPLTVTIVEPEYYFTSVRWTDKFDKKDEEGTVIEEFLENFYLSEAEVEFEGRTYKGLLYIADPATKPGHHQPPTRIEVIAQKIPSINYGDTVTLHYNERAISLDTAALAVC